MPKKESNLKDDMKREEVRGVFTLGLMAVLIAVKLGLKAETLTLLMYFGTIILPVNIPFVSIIDTILATWGLYAFFMVFAYSSDILSPETCDMFKMLGQVCLILSLITIILFAIIIVLTNPTAFIYFGSFLLFVGFLMLILVKTFKWIKKFRARRRNP